VQFPTPFSAMLQSLTIFSMEFLALECLNTSSNMNVYYVTVILWCVLPICAALVIIVIGLIRRAKSSVLGSRESGLVVKMIYDQHIWFLLLLSYLVLPPVSNKQLQAFDCITISTNQKYLRSDTSIDCKSDGYISFRYAVIMFVSLYQLIPITWMFLLFRRKELLNPSTSNHDEKLSAFIRDNNPSLASLKFLFVDYKCNKWWFEIADMYRRIIFIGIVPLVSPDPATRASFGVLLAIVSVAYFREEQPYRVEFTNLIAYIGQVSTYTLSQPHIYFSPCVTFDF
jgi:hypothetical protein